MADVRLGVMQLVHARPDLLPAIWRNMRQLRVQTHLQVVLSRPTREVLDKVIALENKPTSKLTVEVLEAPFSPLDDTERFRELRRWQHERLPEDCDYGVLWDDDHLLEYPDLCAKLLRSGAWDLLYATKLFFWDSPAQFTTHIPTHRSVFFFRCLPADAFPLDRTIHAPARIHDTGKKVGDLPGYLLDYGYMTPFDRERCWNDYKRVGKIDPATLALVSPPDLHEWRGLNPYGA